MEKTARILFICLTFLAFSSSAIYHNLLAPPQTKLTVDGFGTVARIVYEQEREDRFGGERLGILTYYIEKYKLYRKMGKFGKYFRKRKKSK